MGWSLINSERYFLFFLTNSLYGKKGRSASLLHSVQGKPNFPLSVRNENAHISCFPFLYSRHLRQVQTRERERPPNKNNIIPDISDPLSNFIQPDSLASFVWSTRESFEWSKVTRHQEFCVCSFLLVLDVTKGQRFATTDSTFVSISHVSLQPRRAGGTLLIVKRAKTHLQFRVNSFQSRMHDTSSILFPVVSSTKF